MRLRGSSAMRGSAASVDAVKVPDGIAPGQNFAPLVRAADIRKRAL